MAKSKFNFWKTMALFFAFVGSAFLLWSITPNGRQVYTNKGQNSKIVFLKTSSTAQLGTFLVDKQGRTLYAFKSDKNGKSVCTGECAKTWLPFIKLNNGIVANSITGALGTFERADKSLQMTYIGQPLYLYAKDLKPGDTNGNNFNNLWTIVKP
jgi:predicted lipoprotein with Yx(FWY)xxD motif